MIENSYRASNFVRGSVAQLVSVIATFSLHKRLALSGRFTTTGTVDECGMGKFSAWFKNFLRKTQIICISFAYR